ncbi:MAG: hypothetical protein JWP27_2755 [Flaviaesturariibacter sp.]|nr:hypothetical protein [Flaviaesturariibacter sp.]
MALPVTFYKTMENQDLRVHGSIFFLLKKFVVAHFSEDMWDQLNGEAGTGGKSFEMTQNYPLDDIGAIVGAASRHTGASVNELKEKFGEYLVPDLFRLYASYLRPEWTTRDVLIHTEKVMHGAVRKLNSTANPPILNVSEVSETLLVIDYFSRRRMGSLAVGIIKGIARYFGEQDVVQVTPTTDPDDERVQIRVTFQKVELGS